MKRFTYRILLLQLFITGSLFFIAHYSIGQNPNMGDVLVRLDETSDYDRQQTLLYKETALLERNLDDSYFQTTSEGKLYFRFLEKYVDAKLDVSVYNWKREKLLQIPVEISKKYGENWYVLDGTKIGLNGLEVDNYYFVEVLDENKQKTVLRFKYLLNQVPLRLSCQGDNSNFPRCNQDINIINRDDDVTINASIEQGMAPFKITWTLIKEGKDDNGNIIIIRTELDKEETTSELDHTYTKTSNLWESPYKIEFKVVDNCGNEKKCIFCVTSENDERISSEKKSKFFLFFKLKRDKKDNTDPVSPKDTDNTNN